MDTPMETCAKDEMEIATNSVASNNMQIFFCMGSITFLGFAVLAVFRH